MNKLYAIALSTICLAFLNLNAINEPKKPKLKKKNNMNVIKVTINPNTNPPLVCEMKYEILEKGDESKGVATKGKKVAVHYTGWLDKDGKQGDEFDCSLKRGTPIVFTLGAGFVIKGWDEGLVGMKMGEKRRLHIPFNLAYGSRSAGEKIPEYSNLIFEVQLVGMAA